MKIEDQDLLLKDLCGRLPYGVKCQNFNHVYGKNVFKVTDIRDNGYVCGTINNQHGWAVFDPLELKPYLFPLRSLTSSEAEAVEHIMGCNFPWNIQYGLLEWTVGGSVESETFDLRIEQIERLMEFFNSHHIDFRGLIPMGLAIDATGLNIYKEETK